MTDDVARQTTARALSAGGLMRCALLGQAKRYAGCPWASHVVAAVDAEPPFASRDVVREAGWGPRQVLCQGP
jgi:hypothetical protein